jgi:hypothetical protein
LSHSASSPPILIFYACLFWAIICIQYRSIQYFLLILKTVGRGKSMSAVWHKHVGASLQASWETKAGGLLAPRSLRPTWSRIKLHLKK